MCNPFCFFGSIAIIIFIFTDRLNPHITSIHHQPLTEGVAEVLDNGNVKITFDEPIRAITKGQSVVLYNGEIVLGGGCIVKTEIM